LKKAKHPWVKKFAEFEVAEQETVAEVLKAAGAQPGKVDDKDTAAIKKLQEAGDTFDRDYLAAQIDGHQKLLKIQETYISAGKDKEHVGMAKLARGQIKEHIELLKMIQKEAKA
jgi:predicted outer membrane protein